jgi:hypothetical protein
MKAAVEREVMYADGPGFRIEVLGDTHAMIQFEPCGQMPWNRFEVKLVRQRGNFEVLKRRLWTIAVTRKAWLSRGDSPASWLAMALTTGLLDPR